MKIISLILLVLLFISSIAATKENIDKDLRVFRFSFEEFSSASRIQIDKSFFEIYGKITAKVRKFESPYKNLHKIWKYTCENFDTDNLSKLTGHMLNVLCEKTSLLLESAEKLHVTALNEFFSGPLMKKSLPMIYFDKICDSIEENIDKIWDVYIANGRCTKSYLHQIIPIFKPFVTEILNVTNSTIESIDKHYEHCQEFHDIAVEYVYKFLYGVKLCKFRDDEEYCMKRLILKELKCANNCGRLFSSLRSATLTTTEATKKLRKSYINDLYDIGDIEFYTKEAIKLWISNVKKRCLRNVVD